MGKAQVVARRAHGTSRPGIRCRTARRGTVRQRDLGIPPSGFPLPAFLTVAGALWTIAFGRWGSYIGLPGSYVFLPDVLTVAGLTALILTGAWRRARASVPVQAALIAIVLVGYAVLRMAWAQHSFALELRDSAPLLYIAVAPMFVVALRMLGASRALRLLRGACWVHLAWALPAAIGMLSEVNLLPTAVAAEPFFALRNDFDSVVLALGAVMAVAGLGRRVDHRGADLLLGGLSVLGLLAQSSRAGVVAMAMISVFLLAMYKPWRRHLGRVVASIWLLAFGAMSLIALDVAGTPVIEHSAVATRLGLGGGTEADHLQQSAKSTAAARLEAWSLVWDYTNTGHSRPVVGAGPGSDLLRESGALAYLSGDIRVRAPHSWPLGAYARFGIVGSGLWLLLVLAMVVPPGARRRPGGSIRPSDRHSAGAPWAALAVGLFAASCVGVIMESPFGALPFALGLAGFRAFHTSRSDDLAEKQPGSMRSGSGSHTLARAGSSVAPRAVANTRT